MSATQPSSDLPSPDADAQAIDSSSPQKRRLPHINEPRLASRPETAGTSESGNPVFEGLVQGENDIIGLLAYALYKQNKRDWLASFQATVDRAPAAAEIAAYTMGERLPRRVATYRRLAEDMLAASGKPGGPMMHPANDAGLLPQPVAASGKAASGKGLGNNAMALRTIGGLLLLVIAMAIVFRLAGTWLFGTPGR
jgi:hypothetical protein